MITSRTFSSILNSLLFLSVIGISTSNAQDLSIFRVKQEAITNAENDPHNAEARSIHPKGESFDLKIELTNVTAGNATLNIRANLMLDIEGYYYYGVDNQIKEVSEFYFINDLYWSATLRVSVKNRYEQSQTSTRSIYTNRPGSSVRLYLDDILFATFTRAREELEKKNSGKSPSKQEVMDYLQVEVIIESIEISFSGGDKLRAFIDNQFEEKAQQEKEAAAIQAEEERKEIDSQKKLAEAQEKTEPVAENSGTASNPTSSSAQTNTTQTASAPPKTRQTTRKPTQPTKTIEEIKKDVQKELDDKIDEYEDNTLASDQSSSFEKVYGELNVLYFLDENNGDSRSWKYASNRAYRLSKRPNISEEQKSKAEKLAKEFAERYNKASRREEEERGKQYYNNRSITRSQVQRPPSNLGSSKQWDRAAKLNSAQYAFENSFQALSSSLYDLFGNAGDVSDKDIVEMMQKLDAEKRAYYEPQWQAHRINLAMEIANIAVGQPANLSTYLFSDLNKLLKLAFELRELTISENDIHQYDSVQAMVWGIERIVDIFPNYPEYFEYHAYLSRIPKYRRLVSTPQLRLYPKTVTIYKDQYDYYPRSAILSKFRTDYDLEMGNFTVDYFKDSNDLKSFIDKLTEFVKEYHVATNQKMYSGFMDHKILSSKDPRDNYRLLFSELGNGPDSEKRTSQMKYDVYMMPNGSDFIILNEQSMGGQYFLFRPNYPMGEDSLTRCSKISNGFNFTDVILTKNGKYGPVKREGNFYGEDLIFEDKKYVYLQETPSRTVEKMKSSRHKYYSSLFTGFPGYGVKIEMGYWSVQSSGTQKLDHQLVLNPRYVNNIMASDECTLEYSKTKMFNFENQRRIDYGDFDKKSGQANFHMMKVTDVRYAWLVKPTKVVADSSYTVDYISKVEKDWSANIELITGDKIVLSNKPGEMVEWKDIYEYFENNASRKLWPLSYSDKLDIKLP